MLVYHIHLYKTRALARNTIVITCIYTRIGYNIKYTTHSHTFNKYTNMHIYMCMSQSTSYLFNV